MRSMYLAVFVTCSILSQNSFAENFQEAPRQNLWHADADIRSTATSGGVLYLAGNFNMLAPRTGSLVQTDVTTGNLVPGLPEVQGDIYAVIPDGAGGWYIGGSFSKVGSLARQSLAHILPNGEPDENFTVELNGSSSSAFVYSLLIHDGKLYVGGTFNSVNFEFRNCLFSVDIATGSLTSWSPFELQVAYSVRSLVATNGKIYAAGSFFYEGGAPGFPVNLVAFDAITGERDETFTHVFNAEIFSMTVSDTRLYVAGSFWDVNGQARSSFAALDTIDGSLLPLSIDMPGAIVTSMAVSNGVIYFGGQLFTVNNEFRNGLAAIDEATGAVLPWDPAMTSSDQLFINALIVSGNTVFVGGSFTSLRGVQRLRLAAIDATSGDFLDFHPNIGGTINALALNNSSLAIGGFFNSAGGVLRRGLGALSLGHGRALPWNPSPDKYCDKIVIKDGTVFVSGLFTNIGNQERQWLAAVNAYTGEVLPWNPQPNNLITDMEISEHGLHIGGYFTQVNGQPRAHHAAVSPITGALTEWSVSTTIQPHRLKVAGNSVFISGFFQEINGQPRNGLAEVSTTTGELSPWVPLSTNLASDIVVADTRVYLSTYYALAGGSENGGVQVLDRTTGELLSEFPVRGIFSGALFQNQFYAGGFFTQHQNVWRSGLIELNPDNGTPTEWMPNADGVVTQLLASRLGLIASGQFTRVGDYDVGSVAVFNLKKGAPDLSWATPADIGYGTALSAMQLNAASTYPGTYEYNPPIGTVLNAGAHTLSVLFTPASTTRRAIAKSINIRVLRQPLTITADSFSRVIRTPNPALTATYSGFVNGESPANLDSAAVLKTSAKLGSPVGDYPITVSKASDKNYTITFVPGTLSVTNAVPVIHSSPTALPNPAVAGRRVQFSVVASDADGHNLTYAWDFGDGTTGAGATPRHAFSSAGSYHVTITVSDPYGGTASDSLSVEVNPAP